MVENITITFAECTPTPANGYNIQYRVVGSGGPLIDAGNFSTPPAVIPVSYPDGTQFEGIIRTNCGSGIFGPAVAWGGATVPPVDDDCTCRFAYPGEDNTAGQNRSFDLIGTYYFQFTAGGDILLKLLSTTGQLIFGKYGVGTFIDNDSDWMIGADASGNVYERIVKGTTYSPNVTMITNLSQAYLLAATYLRIGNVLQVGIVLELYPIASSGECVLEVDLPLPTTYYSSATVFGVGAIDVPSTVDKLPGIAYIVGIGSVGVITFKFNATSINANFANIQLQYFVA